MLALMHLLRVGGMVMVLGFLLATIIVFANAGMASAAAPGLMTLLGLAIAVAADKRIDREKAKRDEQLQREAQNFQGASLTSGMRWIQWTLGTFAVVGIAYFVAMYVWPDVFRHKFVDDPGMYLVRLGMSALVVVGLTNLLNQGWQVLQAGHLLHMDALGFSHAGLPHIAWREVRGIDLHVFNSHKGVKFRYLMLALNETAWNSMRPSLAKQFFQWAGPRVDAKKPVLIVPCRLAVVPAFTLMEAAKKIADSAGAHRVKSWGYYQSIEDAEAFDALVAGAREKKELIERHMARMTEMTKAPPKSAAEMAAWEAQLDKLWADDLNALSAKVSNSGET